MNSNDIKKEIARRTDKYRRTLQRQGKYFPEMLRQIEATVKLEMRLETMEGIMFGEGYSPIISTKSREGDKRVSLHPLEENYRKYMDQYQTSLKALGMNNDSKERKKEDDDYISGIVSKFKTQTDD